MRTIGEAQINKKKPHLTAISFGAALSPRSSPFAPLLFSGRIPQGFQTAAEAGFRAVELSLRTPDEVNSEELTDLLDTYELSLSAIATGRSYIEDSLSLSSPNAEVRNQAIQRVEGLIQLAAPFKAAVIIGGIRGRLDGTTSEQPQLRKSAILAIRECARYANELGVILLIEPINRYETNLLNTVAETLEFIQAVGALNIGITADTFHMNIEESSIADSLIQAGDRLWHVHLVDSNRRAVGMGHIEFGSIIAALRRVDYQGYLSAEVLPWPDDETASRRWIDATQQLMKG